MLLVIVPTSIKNDLFLRALRREPVPHTPIWIMRQAGRYLPEYRALRKEAGSFMNLCSNPELACEVTMQPLRRFNLDAAILFSDILTVPDAMGLGLYFEEGEGPKFKFPVNNETSIKKLFLPDVQDELSYVFSAVSRIKRELRSSIPLIGFAGSPWTVATYMVEGGSSKTHSKIKNLLYKNPKSLKLLLNKVATVTIDYLNAQIEAGVDVIMLFDTWGAVLGDEHYVEFSLDYMRMISDELNLNSDRKKIPVIFFTKGAGSLLNEMSRNSCDALGVDWTISLSSARDITNHRVALQGNMNPKILTLPSEEIISEAKRILQDYGSSDGHIFNLGHGITPDIDPEKVAVLVDTVHKESEIYHQ